MNNQNSLITSKLNFVDVNYMYRLLKINQLEVKTKIQNFN